LKEKTSLGTASGFDCPTGDNGAHSDGAATAAANPNIETLDIHPSVASGVVATNSNPVPKKGSPPDVASSVAPTAAGADAYKVHDATVGAVNGADAENASTFVATGNDANTYPPKIAISKNHPSTGATTVTDGVNDGGKDGGTAGHCRMYISNLRDLYMFVDKEESTRRSELCWSMLSTHLVWIASAPSQISCVN